MIRRRSRVCRVCFSTTSFRLRPADFGGRVNAPNSSRVSGRIVPLIRAVVCLSCIFSKQDDCRGVFLEVAWTIFFVFTCCCYILYRSNCCISIVLLLFNDRLTCKIFIYVLDSVKHSLMEVFILHIVCKG